MAESSIPKIQKQEEASYKLEKYRYFCLIQKDILKCLDQGNLNATKEIISSCSKDELLGAACAEDHFLLMSILNKDKVEILEEIFGSRLLSDREKELLMMFSDSKLLKTFIAIQNKLIEEKMYDHARAKRYLSLFRDIMLLECDDMIRNKPESPQTLKVALDDIIKEEDEECQRNIDEYHQKNSEKPQKKPFCYIF